MRGKKLAAAWFVLAVLCLTGFSRLWGGEAMHSQAAGSRNENQSESQRGEGRAYQERTADGQTGESRAAGNGETGEAAQAGDGTGNDRGRIARGVKIGEVDVGGLTQEEAKQAVEEYFAPYRNGTLCLSIHGEEAEIGFGQLGMSWDNPEVISQAAACARSGNLLERYREERRIEREEEVLPFAYSVEDGLLLAWVNAQAEEHNTPAVDAAITRRGGSFTVTPSADGLSVDVEATLERIRQELTGYQGGELRVEAVTEVLEPKYKEEELSLIQDCLGEHSTSYNAASADRSQNLVNGTGFIDGVVLLPGETLSLYDYLYPCTEENGYRSAIAYVDGGYVDSIGGGICQISTTLYNALLKAELKVLTRSPHSMTVSYAEPGFDSAQAEGSKDLSFMNSTEYPVYLEAWAVDGELHTALWGRDDRPDNREVVYYNEIISRVSPGDPIYTEDPSLPAGTTVTDQQPYDAIKAALYKQVLIDGEVVETTLLHTDRYRASPAKIRVGTGAPAESPTEAPAEETPAQ